MGLLHIFLISSSKWVIISYLFRRTYKEKCVKDSFRKTKKNTFALFAHFGDFAHIFEINTFLALSKWPPGPIWI